MTDSLVGPVWLSLKVATVGSLLLLPVGVWLGWLMARGRFVGKGLVELLLNIPLVVPPVVTGYFLLIVLGRQGLLGQPLYTLLGVRLSSNLAAAVIAAMVMSLPFVVRSVRVAVDLVDPRLEQAAKTLGKPGWVVFLRVTLPLSWPGIIAGLTLAFARSLGEFGATIVFAGNIPQVTETIPIAIFSTLQRPGGETSALVLAAFAVAISAIALWVSETLMQRHRRAVADVGG